MIFAPAQVRQILAGKKTTMRLTASEFRPAKHRPGGTVPIRSTSGVSCRIRIIEIREAWEPVCEISAEDARREGFRSPGEFWQDWADRRGLVFPLTERSRSQLVRVVRFRVVEESPRLLAADPGALRSDYTSQPAKAMRGEPEAISAGYQALATEDAHARFAVLHADEIRRRRANSAAKRAQIAVRDAILRGVDVSAELDAIAAKSR